MGLLDEELLLIFSRSRHNLWGVLELLSGLLLVLELGGSFREIHLGAAGKLDLDVLGELLLLLLLDEEGLELSVHGGLAFALVLRLAEIVKAVIMLLLLGGKSGGILFLVGSELNGAVKFLDSVLGFTISRRFTNFVDAIESRVEGERAIDEIIDIAVALVIIVAFFSQGVTTLLALFTAASDEHGDEAGNEEHQKEADEAACNGRVEDLVVLGDFGGFRHDE